MLLLCKFMQVLQIPYCPLQVSWASPGALGTPFGRLPVIISSHDRLICCPVGALGSPWASLGPLSGSIWGPWAFFSSLWRWIWSPGRLLRCPQGDIGSFRCRGDASCASLGGLWCSQVLPGSLLDDSGGLLNDFGTLGYLSAMLFQILA